MPDWTSRYLGYVSWGLDWIAQHASIVTAAVAICALIVAARTLATNRLIAQRRAALDIFFKTEMDSAVLNAYDEFDKTIAKFREAGQSPETFLDDDANYRKLVSYLNIHELIAVGIHNGVLDERVCFEFWSDELMEAYQDAEELILAIRKRDLSNFSFVDLEELSHKWAAVTKEMIKLDLRHPIKMV